MKLRFILVTALSFLCCATPVFATDLNIEDGYIPDVEYAPPAEGEIIYPANEFFGYDKGFFIRDPEDNFLLRVNGITQIRALYAHADDLSDYHPFQVRRTALYFSGHFIDPSWTYILGTLAAADGTFTLDNTYIAKAFTKNTWLQVGEFYTPFLRETILFSGRQLAVERSLVTKYFSNNASTGALFGTEGDHFKWTLAATNGDFVYNKALDESGNNNVGNVVFSEGLSYAFISRLEFKPLGNWQEFITYTSPGGNATGLLIGAAVAYQRDNNTLPTEEISTTVDITFQGSGWNMSSMVAYLDDPVNHFDSYGAQVQGGLFVDELRKKLELFSRYEWGNAGPFDPVLQVEKEDLSLLTNGFNYYLIPGHLKLSLDFGYAFSNIGRNWADPTDGWRITADAGQWVTRTQMQFTF